MTTKTKPKKEEAAELEFEEEAAVAVAETVDLVPIADQRDFMYRLATDPNVDVDKLERLIAMQERADQRAAQAAFTKAFVAMQAELPEIPKAGRNPTLKSSYAKFEDIQRLIRPVLEKHGFVLNFFTDTVDGIEVTARLSHQGGHYEQTAFKVDKPGELKNRGVNDVQAKGSATSYAKRYATAALLNLTTVDEDDDGASSEAPEAPKGYTSWLADMGALADEGTEALEAAWKKSKKQFRAYITKHTPEEWARIKNAAAEVKS